MEAHGEKLLLGCSSFLTEDSFLLSDYLQRQAERAGSRLFNNENPFMFLRSRIFSPGFGQTKGEEILDGCYPPVSESMPMGLCFARKESSESFIGKKCSSNVLSELEQEKGDSSLLHSTLASSDSCVESSQNCESESAAGTVARLDESLHTNMLNCESKQAVFLSNNGEEVEGAVDGSHIANKHNTDALNLLIIAAMQDNEDDTVLDPLVRGNGEHSTSPVYGSNPCPVLKKRVIRRAKSAFRKQFPDDFRLTRFRFCDSVTRHLERKGNYAAEHHMKGWGNLPERRKGRATCAKRRKLQDLPLSPVDDSVKEYTDVDESLEWKYGAAKHHSNEDPNSELVEVGQEIHFKGGDSQESVYELPSSFSTEGAEIACRQNKNHGTFINYRKLQISSSRLDTFNAEDSKGAHLKDRQSRIRAEPDMHSLPLSTDHLSFGGTELKRDPLIQRLKEAEFRVAPSGDMNHGHSILRLKILPIRLPSAGLPLLEEVSTMTGSEIVTESRMVTRKRSASHVEADKTCASTTEVSSLVQHAAIQMAINQNPVMRTKRGRSQVLPTKFSDSVLQPWKSSRRKTRVFNA